MTKRYNLFLDERLAAVVEAKAAEELTSGVEWIKDVIKAHALGKCGALVATAPAASSESVPVEKRGPGRPPGTKNKTAEAQVRAMSTAELQAFLEETGYICVGGVEQDRMPDGKINSGTFTKTFVRWNPAKSENEYCVGYFYNSKFLDDDGRRLEPENVNVTQTLSELIGDLKRKNII